MSQDLRKNLDMSRLIPTHADFGLPRDSVQTLAGGQRTFPKSILIDLSVARVSEDFRIAGSMFFIDNSPGNTGFASVEFGDDSVLTDPISVAVGSLVKLSFTKIRVTNSIQTGKFLRVFYGSDFDFSALSNNKAGPDVIPGSVGNAIRQNFNPGTPVALIDPSQNTSGIILHSVNFQGRQTPIVANLCRISLLASSVSPPGPLSGICLKFSQPGTVNPTGTEVFHSMEIDRSITIAAGLGIWIYNDTAGEVVNGAVTCFYETV